MARASTRASRARSYGLFAATMSSPSRLENEQDWLITEVLQRRNQLSRPNMRGDIEILAANVDLLLVVAAVSPAPDWYIVDRYLCAAANMKANAVGYFQQD